MAANQVALDAEQVKDAVEQVVEDLKNPLRSKRPRAEPCTIEDNAGMPADVGDLDLADHRWQATRWWNRFKVELVFLNDLPAPRLEKMSV